MTRVYMNRVDILKKIDEAKELLNSNINNLITVKESIEIIRYLCNKKNLKDYKYSEFETLLFRKAFETIKNSDDLSELELVDFKLLATLDSWSNSSRKDVDNLPPASDGDYIIESSDVSDFLYNLDMYLYKSKRIVIIPTVELSEPTEVGYHETPLHSYIPIEQVITNYNDLDKLNEDEEEKIKVLLSKLRAALDKHFLYFDQDVFIIEYRVLVDICKKIMIENHQEDSNNIIVAFENLRRVKKLNSRK